MRRSAHEQRLRGLIDADVPAGELERLGRVDTLLRAVAGRDRDEAATEPRRSSLSLVAAPTPTEESTCDDESHDVKLTYGELVLVHKSLQAVRALGHLPPHDELLDDTIHVVELALAKAL